MFNNLVYTLCVFSVFLLSASTFEEKNFDSIYYHTTVTVAANNLDDALEIADSLFVHSESIRNKVKSLMLSSSLYQQKGDLAQSIHIAEEANSLASTNKMYDWQARISGFLSTQYRLMEMYSEGERYLEEGISTSKRVENEQMSYLFQGLVLQEKTFYFLAYEKFNKALSTAQEAEENFTKLESDRDRKYFLASNHELLGRVSVKMEDWDLAESYLSKALAGFEDLSGDNFMIKGQVYSLLGRVYLEKGKLDLSMAYLQKAESMLLNSSNLSLELEVYKTLSDYYYLMGDNENHTYYMEKHIRSFKKSESKKKASINNFIESTKRANLKLTKNRSILLGSTLFLSLLVIIITVFFKYKQKKQKKLFQKSMEDVLNPVSPSDFSNNIEKQKRDKEFESALPSKNKEHDAVMSEESVKSVLKKLQLFEKENGFLDKTISISKLASIIETNNKYLSHVLNTYKKQNFNSYINELRIKYIIVKLNNEKVYRNYKISYLAEETGFSSHTKFSLAFKNVTGLSPSIFIRELEKTKK